MELNLIRRYKGDTYTVGQLYVNGIYFCDTLEKQDRNLCSELSIAQIKKKKVKGKTAIPTGTYEIELDSEHDVPIPRLKAVKGFSGVFIQPEEDLSSGGCIQVGELLKVGKLLHCTENFNTLFSILKSFKEKIIITIS